jgi:hypothetical protein
MYVNKFCAQFNNTYKSKFYSLNSSSKKKKVRNYKMFYISSSEKNEQTGWFCEYSKSNKSTCKGCLKKLDNNELRFGIYFKVNIL